MPSPSMSRQVKRLASFLAARRGQFVHRHELLTQVFDHPADSKSRTVDTHIQRLLQMLPMEEIITARSRLRHGYILATRPGADL